MNLLLFTTFSLLLVTIIDCYYDDYDYEEDDYRRGRPAYYSQGHVVDVNIHREHDHNLLEKIKSDRQQRNERIQDFIASRNGRYSDRHLDIDVDINRGPSRPMNYANREIKASLQIGRNNDQGLFANIKRNRQQRRERIDKFIATRKGRHRNSHLGIDINRGSNDINSNYHDSNDHNSNYQGSNDQNSNIQGSNDHNSNYQGSNDINSNYQGSNDINSNYHDSNKQISNNQISSNQISNNQISSNQISNNQISSNQNLDNLMLDEESDTKIESSDEHDEPQYGQIEMGGDNDGYGSHEEVHAWHSSSRSVSKFDGTQMRTRQSGRTGGFGWEKNDDQLANGYLFDHSY